MTGARFRFKELDAYQVALRFHGWALSVAGRLPRSEWRTADQFVRASMSMVLNTAEASGRWSPGDKRHYFAIARGSAFETAAMLDVLAQRHSPTLRAMLNQFMITLYQKKLHLLN